MGKTSIIYFLGNVLSRSIGFFLLPLYTKFILPEDYGYFDVSISYLALFSSVIFFEIHNGILRYVIKSDNPIDKDKYIYSGISIYLSSMLVYSIIFGCIYVLFDIKHLPLIYICGIFENFLFVLLAISRGYGKNTLYAISGLIGAAVIGISNIIFIAYLNLGYTSLYYSLILSYIIQILFLEFYLHLIPKFKKQNINKANIRILLTFALPLCLNSMAYWGLTGYNKIAINSLLGFESSGIYAIVYKFSFIINLFMSCFLLAWQEVAFSNKNQSDFYNKAINSYILFVGVGAIMILPIISVVFPYIIDESYSTAKNAIPLLICGTMLSTISTFLGSIYGAIEKTKIIVYTTIIGCIVNISLVHLLLNIWGLNGANVSFTLAFMCCVSARIYILKKNIYIKLNWGNIFLIVSCIIIAYLIFIKCSPLWNFTFFLLIGLLLAILLKKHLLALYYYARKKNQ